MPSASRKEWLKRPMADIWTVKRILDWTVDYFTTRNISEPRLSAEWLLASVLNGKRLDLYIQFERILSTRERDTFREYVKRRADFEPVQYILGETEFMGLPFTVSPEVLIPRPDTECLVDAICEYAAEAALNNAAILEIGTGSGCIAVALAKMLPQNHICAIEKSPGAVQIARRNAEQNGAEIEFIEGDCFEMCPGMQRRFEIIVSNPPYIAEGEWEGLQPEVRRFEPQMALLAGSDGFDFYRRFSPLAANMLSEKGRLFLETGHRQAGQVAEMLREHGFHCDIRRDYSGIERVVIARRNDGDQRDL